MLYVDSIPLFTEDALTGLYISYDSYEFIVQWEYHNSCALFQKGLVRYFVLRKLILSGIIFESFFGFVFVSWF